MKKLIEAGMNAAGSGGCMMAVGSGLTVETVAASVASAAVQAGLSSATPAFVVAGGSVFAVCGAVVSGAGLVALTGYGGYQVYKFVIS